jgi:hypothetical protein
MELNLYLTTDYEAGHMYGILKKRNVLPENNVRFYLLTHSMALVTVELWPPHIAYVRFRDSKFLQGGVVSPTPNPQPGGPM